MESGLVKCSHNVSSLITGGSFWKSKHPTNNICYARFRTSKVSQHKREIQKDCNVPRFQQSSLNHRYKCIEGNFTHQERSKKYIVQATPTPSFDSERSVDHVKNFLDLCYQLCYPYSMIGLTLAAMSSSFLAVERLSDISLSFIISVFQALVTHMLATIYVNAVNQVFDFEIDKINKPDLPLASGRSSLTTAVVIATSCLALSLGMSWKIGSWPLLWNNILQALIWSIYSVDAPLLRWKRHPVLASICTTLAGGVVMPIAFFLHAQNFLLKRPIIVSRSIIASVLSMTFYYVGISLSKDISDVEGDKMHGIDTFAIRWGQKRVFWICNFLFQMALGVAFVGGITSPYLWIKVVTGVGNAVLASILWYQAKSIDLSNKSSVRSFYMLVWKSLYAIYFTVALIR